MKYKKQIATGALAISLLVGGSSVFAASPQDLGIKNSHPTYQKQNKHNRDFKPKHKNKGNIVGTVGAINSSGFTIEVINRKTKVASSVDIATSTGTVYKKNGLDATISDLAVGQKVIVSGKVDKTTNILTAKTVRIVTQKIKNQ